jgi:hypothetical protein
MQCPYSWSVGSNVAELPEGWKVLSCRPNGRWPLFFMFFQSLVGNPDIMPVASTATWTVQETATGAVRKVTAHSQEEATERIANGYFDDK